MNVLKLATPILIFLSFYSTLGFFPLFDLDEGAFSEATREMLISGNYITTYLNGELRFDKPILIYWIQAFSVNLFGLSEFSFRLPSAIAASIWAYAIYKFVKDYFDQEKALVSLLFFNSALVISIMAKAATADALLNMWIVLSMFSIYRYYDNHQKKYLMLSFLFMGFGVLTKGPVAVMIPLIVTLIFFGIKQQFLFWLKSVFNPFGILIFLAVALPWHVLEYIDQGQKFIDGFILKHNIDRFNTSFEGHDGGYFYYLIVLPFIVAPFSIFLIRAIFNFKQIFRNDLQLFLFIWFVFVVVFFSFSGTKLPHYLVYGLTPLFILGSVYFSQVNSKLYIFFPAILVLGIFALLPDLIRWFEYKINDDYVLSIKEHIFAIFDAVYQLEIFLLMVLLLFLVLYFKQKEYQMISAAAIFVVTVNFIIIPTVAKVEQEPIKNIAEYATKNQLKNIDFYRMNNPSFSVYTNSIVTNKPPIPGSILLTKKNHLSNLRNYTILHYQNGIYLVRMNNSQL